MNVLAQAFTGEEARRTRQEEKEEEFQEAIGKTHESLTETEGPDMKERMKDQIRQWFIECQSVSTTTADPTFRTSSPNSRLFSHVLSLLYQPSPSPHTLV